MFVNTLTLRRILLRRVGVRMNEGAANYVCVLSTIAARAGRICGYQAPGSDKKAYCSSSYKREVRTCG